MREKRPEHTPATAMDLRGKQSVRATFRLSEKAIDYLSLVAVHLGIKQKSLFDHLMNDATALRDIAATVPMGQFNQIERIQKTFVLSRRTLDVLELISGDLDTPRDALVEYSIYRLEAVIQAEKKLHHQRKQLFEELRLHWEEGKQLLAKAQDTLGADDPFCLEVHRSMTALNRARTELVDFIKKSSIIEGY